ncbi:lebercilin [Aricia agestis]|uniref:lebercilin n=1 Tax=Aricia agestis TaxID=91739 RepID=UPI001C206D88|nr:lebercilin [Aricia agestis]
MSVLSLVPEEKRKDQRSSLESVYSGGSRLSLLTKRKRDMSRDRHVSQRVLSAKTHRVKALQNQLADAHYHLQELSNENRVLRAMQKKQEMALQRYENSNAELPQILNSHNEEIRVQQTRYKQLKAQYKEVAQKLKERDLQLQQLRDEHQHLQELSKDKNLYEREKLQVQVAELTAKVQQQSETINLLQRRIALEAKNFRHQLQAEINKHKDTRHDLDIAINNADKLSSIIEMKERMLSTAASRGSKSPTKVASLMSIPRPVSKGPKENASMRASDEKNSVDQNVLAKLCENSRSLSSALSNDDTSSSTEPRSRYVTSRTSSSSRATPKPARKPVKDSEDIIELAKTIQDGMADLSIVDDEMRLRNSSPEDMQKRMEAMKADLMSKIKNNEEVSQPGSRKSSAIRRQSTEETIEEQVDEEPIIERPKSRVRRNSALSFDGFTDVTVFGNGFCTSEEKSVMKRENSMIERKASSKPIDKYCKDIMHDIEKSAKVIDVHMKQFSHTQQVSEKLVEQLQAVDKFNDLVNGKGDMSEEALQELNNNFNVLSQTVEAPIPRKRSISGRRNSRVESRTSILGDANMSNQDLLNDLLGHK